MLRRALDVATAWVQERVTATGFDTPEVQEAIILFASRLYKRRQSPEGVAGWGDLGVVRILAVGSGHQPAPRTSPGHVQGRCGLMIVEFRRAVYDALGSTSVPVYWWLPDDPAHLPCHVVGRPAVRESVTPGVATLELAVTLLGRRVVRRGRPDPVGRVG